MTHSNCFRAAVLLAFLAVLSAPAAGEHRLGLGLHYWTTVDDLDEEGYDGDRSGTSLRGSYQWAPPGPLAFELDVEYFADGFGGATEPAWAPVGLLLVELGPVYAGAGVGVTFADDFPGSTSDPFWVARFGFEFAVLPRIHLDFGADYRIDAWKHLPGSDPGTVSLAAVARVVIFN